jgi:type IV pilus assembly protein PilA
MLRKLRERMYSEEKGFTLIELLVVILIIGILAAIAIPAFLGQREKAQDSEAKSAVRTAASAAKSYFTDSQTYTGMDAAALRTVEPSLNQGAASGAGLSVTVNGGGAGYTLAVTAPKTANVFTITEAAGVATRTCTTAGKAGCPTGGNW